jgi:hypothetical protein
VEPRSSAIREQGIACRVAYLRPAAEPTGHPPKRKPRNGLATYGPRNDTFWSNRRTTFLLDERRHAERKVISNCLQVYLSTSANP